MKINKLNFGEPLSREAQKKIKGGTPYCNAGQIIVCKCGSNLVCKSAVGGGVSIGADCSTYCQGGSSALGYVQCYNSCPLTPPPGA